MLGLRNMRCTLDGNSGGTGQNILYYTPSTNEVQYSTNTIGGGGKVYNNVVVSSSVGPSTATFQSCITSDTLVPGTYFVIANYVVNSTSSHPRYNVRLFNNTDSSSVSDFGQYRIGVSNFDYNTGIAGILTLNSSGTVSLQFSDDTSFQFVTMVASTMSCLQLA